MSKHIVSIAIDTYDLAGITDRHLASLWHVAQANPADISDPAAGEIAEAIGREIIRRFLSTTPPELWAHQGRHASWCELQAAREAKSSTRAELRGLAARVRKLGNLYEGPDGCGTEGTELSERIEADITRLAAMEHAGMDRRGGAGGVSDGRVGGVGGGAHGPL